MILIFFCFFNIVAQKKEFCAYITGEEGKLKILNEFGKPISNLTFDNAWEISNELFLVEKNNKRGFLNKEGIMVIPFKFSYAGFMINDVAKVEIDLKYGVINSKGHYII